MKKVILISFLFVAISFAQSKQLMNYDYLWGMKRIGALELSPDGKTIAFTMSIYSMDLNKGNSDIYLIDSDGNNLRPFKNSAKSEANPKFSPDSKKLSYLFEGQIHVENLDGTGAEQVTDIYTGVNDFIWSKDGKKILFTSSVYPRCSDEECNKETDRRKEESKVKASLFTELMYRHWNDWRGEKRSHLFLMDCESKEYMDLIPGSYSDVPPIALGSASDYSISPDGSEIAFTMNPDVNLAVSTNNEIFLVNVNDLQKGMMIPTKKISQSLGNDNQPVYSPDGKFIAFCSMERAGFEADKQRVLLYDRITGTLADLTEKHDISASELIWSPDSKSIYFTAANEIHTSIYKLDIQSRELTTVVNDRGNTNIIVSNDGKKLFFKQQRSTQPYEVFSVNTSDEALTQLTSVNKNIVEKLEMNEVETFWSKGSDGKPVQSIIVKPPYFNPDKKYPMIFLIHGGPQGKWSDDFHYRWNLQMFAAPGYVVVAPNPRGSVGYGQKFTDEISGDWGGKAYEDLMNAYDHAIENFSFIDSKNTFAAGGSYGGYMVNWIAGHTDRFNALVSHAGVFNLESMYGTTEELWFPEWEYQGTPWTNREMYEKFSPHRFIHNCKTPILVVHGAYDFRVPESQAFELFTHLQRLGIESKFLYFPDESHFVSKPQNSRLWWNTIYDWFGKFYVRH
jgi:dipeptidyl aminopeptidase/acylaminoacyl peptidase